jgi:hypothetical protein
MKKIIQFSSNANRYIDFSLRIAYFLLSSMCTPLIFVKTIYRYGFPGLDFLLKMCYIIPLTVFIAIIAVKRIIKMDNDNKLFNSMDEVHTNCSWFCLLKSNEKRPTQIEEKILTILTYTRIFQGVSKFFGKGFENNPDMTQQN